MLFGAGAAAVALLIPWLPDPASEQADRIDFVFWFVTAICIAIFALVAAVIVYSVIHFRAAPRRRRGRPADARPHRPRDRLDGGPGRARDRDLDRQRGRAGDRTSSCRPPRASAARAAQNSTVDGLCKPRSADPLKPLVVCVIAQQFAWLFKYPAYGNATSATLRLPIHTTVQLQLQSLDVIHSFWVPEFGQKQDAVPGLLTKLVITPNAARHLPRDLHRALRPRPRADALRGDRDDRRTSSSPGPRARPAAAPARRRGGAPSGQGALRLERLRRLPHLQAGRRQGNGRAGPR